MVPGLVAVFLFLFFEIRLGLASLFKAFWNDETNGIKESLDYSFFHLISKGASGEASPSPLHYLIDKIWLGFFNNQPQVYGDMRLLLRLPHLTYWSIASVAVFIFVYFFLRKKIHLQKTWIHLFIAAAAATFYHSNSFLAWYAVETRAYSLWASLSTIHFLLFLWCLFFGLTRHLRVTYVVVCILLVLNTYVALYQVLLGLGLEYFFIDRQKLLKKYIILAIPCTLIGLWYFSNVNQMGFGNVTWGIFWAEVKEVISKTFHDHSRKAVYIFLPFLFLIIPYLHRKNQKYRVIYLYLCGMLFYVIALYIGCQLKGNLVASRQMIFLVPYLSCAYALGLYQLAVWVSAGLRKLQPYIKVTAMQVLLLWSCHELILRTTSYTKLIYRDIGKLKERHVLSKTKSSYCPLEFNDNAPELFEKINNFCRNF